MKASPRKAPTDTPAIPASERRAFEGAGAGAVAADSVAVGAESGRVVIEGGVRGYHEGRCLFHMSGTSTSVLFTL